MNGFRQMSVSRAHMVAASMLLLAVVVCCSATSVEADRPAHLAASSSSSASATAPASHRIPSLHQLQRDHRFAELQSSKHHTRRAHRAEVKQDERPAKELRKRLFPNNAEVHRKPVILVPGIMGSRLEMSPTQGDMCGIKKGDWKMVWLVPFSECRTNTIERRIVNGRSQEQADRVIRAVTTDNGLGSVGDLASSASPASWIGATRYYKRIIANLQELGFKSGVDLYAFPHDWRLLTSEDMMADLFKLIQKVTSQIGKKAVMVTHSMGTLRTLGFIKTVESDKSPKLLALVKEAGYASGKDWVLARIDRQVSFAGPLLGSPQSLVHMLSGSKMLEFLWGLIGTKDTDMTRAARTFESLPVLYPVMPEWEQAYPAAKTTPAVEVVQKGRSIPFLMSEIKPLMQFAGFTADQMQMWNTVRGLPNARFGVDPPQVTTSYALPSFFYYSNNLDTTFRLKFVDSKGFDEQAGAAPIPPASLSQLKTQQPVAPLQWDSLSEGKPEIVEKVPGDAVVPLESLRWFTRWKNASGAPVKVTKFDHPATGTFTPGQSIYFKEFTGEHIAALHKNDALVSDILQHTISTVPVAPITRGSGTAPGAPTGARPQAAGPGQQIAAGPERPILQQAA